MDALWQWDAVDVAQAVRTRKVSSREVVAACLKQVEAVNPKINAIIECRPEEALAAADAADAAVARGEVLGPLHGVPVTTKVNVDQQGYATTNGLVALKDNVAADDNPVVGNMRKAGGIFIGRTNTPSFSFRWFTDNDLHGETLNPYNTGLTPGGSSGGAAAAVAAGMGPIGHGNDIGGSIRYPAYACGITGIRPSLGRVPSHNRTSKGERPLTFQLMSVQGPLARSVRDLWLGLAAMSGPDPRDPWCPPAPLTGPQPQRPIRVAMAIDPFGTGVDPLVEQALKDAAGRLSNAGYAVEEVALPSIQEASDLWRLIVMNDAHRSMKAAGLHLGGPAFEAAFHAMLDRSPALDLEGLMRGMERRMTILREWCLFFERYPVVLLPVSMERPFPLGLDQQGAATMERILNAQAPLLAFAVLGLPGVSVPTGFAEGSPMGVQLVAAPFREDLCLDAAEIIEAQTPRTFPQMALNG